MTTDELEPLISGWEEARDRSLPDDVRGLAEQARVFAQAELAYQKSRASYVGSEARTIAMLGALAACLVFFALIGLVVGLIFALAPLITAWGSTALVCGLLLLAALVCALRAKRGLRRAIGTLSDSRAENGG
ncbi:MAG: phage holin family protein [Novosphingobium sp.]